MKNYLSTRKANSRRPWFRKQFKIVAVMALVLLFSYYVLPRVATGVGMIVMAPIEMTRTWLLQSENSLPSYLRDRAALQEELESLRQSAAVSEGNEYTIAKLETENNQFRAMLEAVPGERIVTRVVGRPADLPYDVIMLDRGRADGIIENAPVFVGSDQVIGYVARVYENTSLVTLVTTAGFEAIAYIIGPNIYTYTEGLGGGMLRVRVPQGIPLRVGDVVIFPAIDSGVYGEVAEVTTSPTQPEQFGYVPLPIALQSLQYVTVGREPVEQHTYAEAQEVVDDIRDALFTVELPPGVLVTPETATTTATTTSGMPTSTSATTTN